VPSRDYAIIFPQDQRRSNAAPRTFGRRPASFFPRTTHLISLLCAFSFFLDRGTHSYDDYVYVPSEGCQRHLRRLLNPLQHMQCDHSATHTRATPVFAAAAVLAQFTFALLVHRASYRD
jgi:hypothetical protein